jgi:ribonuclease P/MRP protein subunit RPP40
MGESVSEWKNVTSGVPQGSVIGPLLFIIYINEIPDLMYHICKLYADDNKIIAILKEESDTNRLQQDIAHLQAWCKTWCAKLNEAKCKIMHIGRQNAEQSYTIPLENDNTYTLRTTDCEKDLGIYISNDLKWSRQCMYAANKANFILGTLRRTFTFWHNEMVKRLYTTFVRPHLEYAIQVWRPKFAKDLKILEDVQRRATKLAPSLKKVHYEKRLQVLELTTLSDRQDRGDLIQIYKLAHGLESVNLLNPPIFRNSRTRGHSLRYTKELAIRVPRSNFITNRIAEKWNGLNESVVNAPTVNSFKARYDLLATQT